jgi:hypothetical protein
VSAADGGGSTAPDGHRGGDVDRHSGTDSSPRTFEPQRVEREQLRGTGGARERQTDALSTRRQESFRGSDCTYDRQVCLRKCEGDSSCRAQCTADYACQ